MVDEYDANMDPDTSQLGQPKLFKFLKFARAHTEVCGVMVHHPPRVNSNGAMSRRGVKKDRYTRRSGDS